MVRMSSRGCTWCLCLVLCTWYLVPLPSHIVSIKQIKAQSSKFKALFQSSEYSKVVFSPQQYFLNQLMTRSAARTGVTNPGHLGNCAQVAFLNLPFNCTFRHPEASADQCFISDPLASCRIAILAYRRD